MFNITGSLSLIFDPKIVTDIMIHNGTVKVINLDEENAVPMLCDENNPQVVPGTILLPPVEALWAIIDGNNDQFVQIYYMYLTSPDVMQYIATLITSMYQGTNLIIYYPEENDIKIRYLYEHFRTNYGLTIALNSQMPFRWDPMSIPLYCNSIFSVKGMSARDYLIFYPCDAVIPEPILLELASFIPGNVLSDKFSMIDRMRDVFKRRPDAILPINFPDEGG